MEHPNNEVKKITYSLTFLQRFVNPADMLVYRVLQSLGVVIVACAFFVDIPYIIDVLVPWFLIWMIIVIPYRFVFVRGSLFLQNRKAARSIVLAFESNAIGCGRKKIEYWVQYRKARVRRGLFGANVINADSYGAHYMFVVPESVISLSELRELVEVDKNVHEKA